MNLILASALAIATLFAQPPSFAQERSTTPTSAIEARKNYCQRIRTPGGVLSYLKDPVNLTGVEADSGKLGIGTCWWHSRFQRKVAYLAIFRPDLPRVSTAKFKQLLLRLVAGHIVEIPGFADLSEISDRDYTKVIEDLISDDQFNSGLGKLEFLDHLLHKPFTTRPSVAHAELKKVRQTVDAGDIPFVMWVRQKTEFYLASTHSILVLGYVRIPEQRCLFYDNVQNGSPRFVDSFEVCDGDLDFTYKGDAATPYLAFVDEQIAIRKTANAYCATQP